MISLRVLDHPLRARILAACSKEQRSPSELAEAWEESLGVVSYHFRRLQEEKLLKLVRKRPRRGAVEHYYRTTPKTAELAAQVEGLARLLRSVSASCG